MNKAKAIMVFLFTFLITEVAFSQVNLVPNPSFEENHGTEPCPFNPADSLLWPDSWISPAPTWGGGNPDYFLTWYCNQYSSVPINYAGYQFPFEGNAYTAICVASEILGVTYREYLQTALIDTLEAGHRYCFSAWVSCSDSAGKATDDIGVFFSDTAIYKYDGKNFPFTPQIRNTEGRYLEDKSNWQLFSGSFIASGGERYITIGNFLNDSSTTYTIPEPHSNDVVWLGSGGYYLDMVSLYDCTGFDTTSVIENILEKNIKIYPNPSSNNTTIEFENGIFENAIVELYDLTGQKVLVEAIESGSSKHQINIKGINAGFYYGKVINNGVMLGEQKIVIVK
jgi:hypothetical protein